MKLKILLLFVYGICFSQNKNIRFIYDYKYAPDSTKIDSTFTELMHLDVLEEGSRFYSRDVFVGDSLMNKAIKEQKQKGFVKFDNTKGKVRDVIKKLYPNFNVITTTNVGIDHFVYEDLRKIKWIISDEISSIDGFKVQKATTNAFGRNWTAWFTNAYPFQEGPYKFHGLPGLIVKIEDQSKSQVFSLKAVRVLKQEEVWPIETPKRASKSLINTTREKYKDAFLTYRNNPMKNWVPTKGGIIEMKVTYNGNQLSPKELEKQLKIKLKKDNNILELDLLTEGKK